MAEGQTAAEVDTAETSLEDQRGGTINWRSTYLVTQKLIPTCNQRILKLVRNRQPHTCCSTREGWFTPVAFKSAVARDRVALKLLPKSSLDLRAWHTHSGRAFYNDCMRQLVQAVNVSGYVAGRVARSAKCCWWAPLYLIPEQTCTNKVH
jgi:hypothetical protein